MIRFDAGSRAMPLSLFRRLLPSVRGSFTTPRPIDRAARLMSSQERGLPIMAEETAPAQPHRGRRIVKSLRWIAALIVAIGAIAAATLKAIDTVKKAGDESATKVANHQAITAQSALSQLRKYRSGGWNVMEPHLSATSIQISLERSERLGVPPTRTISTHPICVDSSLGAGTTTGKSR